MRLILLLFILLSTTAFSQSRDAVVVDSISGTPLSKASIFDKNGKAIGISSDNGSLPPIPPAAYPITVRYLGYHPRRLDSPPAGNILMRENISQLSEVVVKSRKNQVLHLLGYVREFSTLSTSFDTVRLYREKNVDFMIPMGKGKKDKGWTRPRLLNSKSYYRFTDATGLDSVSNYFSGNFSWADWIGVIRQKRMPRKLDYGDLASDTLMGKYSPARIWRKSDERVYLDVDVLSDSSKSEWVPELSWLIDHSMDFRKLSVRYVFDNVYSGTVFADNLSSMSFSIESLGRGVNLNRIFSSYGSLYVETYAEVYIIDKEYISAKEARKWEKKDLNLDSEEILLPDDVPKLEASTQEIVDRVNSIDHNRLRLDISPDKRLAGKKDLLKPRKKGLLQKLKSVIM